MKETPILSPQPEDKCGGLPPETPRMPLRENASSSTSTSSGGLSRAALHTLKDEFMALEVSTIWPTPGEKLRLIDAASMFALVGKLDALLTAPSSPQEEKFKAEIAGLHALLAEVQAVSELPADLHARVNAVLGATDPEGSCGNRLCDELMAAHQRADAADVRLQALTGLLAEIEQHCPCGARPESPRTHPHVVSCPVAKAVGLLTPASAEAPDK